MTTKKIGVLLINTGTPEAPTTKAVRRYLREFLSDRNVVRLPRLFWLPILHGIILPLRPRKSAKLYQNIWTNDGSPLRYHMLNIGAKLQTYLNQKTNDAYKVVIGMNYGSPSIQSAVDQLCRIPVDELIVLPLFPQYSTTTTLSALTRTQDALKKAAHKPNTHTIDRYADNDRYIDALKQGITNAWQQQPPSPHLLISFHGIPKRFVNQGDPYQQQCELTAERLAKKLNLAKDQWTLCYQSRFGYDKWLQPSTQDLLSQLPKQGVTSIDILCPGFACDCLETLEEIALTGKEIFLAAGGQSLRYIPALNDSAAHIECLSELIQTHLQQN